jgi:hypothetical protein
MRDCIISHNASRIHGGGINAVMRAGTLHLFDCTISLNRANPGNFSGSYVGGGMRIEGNSFLSRCSITENVCMACALQSVNRDSFGGGLYAIAGQTTLRNCIITDNRAQFGSCGGNNTRRAYGAGIFMSSGTLTAVNCIVASNSTAGATSSQGSGLFISTGTGSVVNCTIAYNNSPGLSSGPTGVEVINSIVFFNASGGTQITGTTNVSYSDVQNGFAGTGNKNFNPVFRSTTNLIILPGSQCIDMGNPAPVYNDACFPPSLGSVRNDVGAHGGPGACCWEEKCAAPVIRSQPQNFVSCVGGEASFCVSATGTAPLSYQWRFHGASAGGAAADILGATNACLNLIGIESNHDGYYSVQVANLVGAVVSNPALLTVTPICLDIELYAGLTLNGGVAGQPYRIQSAAHVNDTNWVTRSTITQTVSGVFWLDPEPATRERRFYRAIPSP